MANTTDIGPRTPVVDVSTPAARKPAASTPKTTAATTAAADASSAQSATQVINQFFASVPGLATLDPTGQLQAWANSQVKTLSGQGMTSGDISTQIESTINNPMASGDQAAQNVFDAIMPGYNQKIANGTTNADGSYSGIGGYLQLYSQTQAMAQVAGIPGGINAQTFGDLWQNNVSSSEISSRITQGYVAANNAWNTIPGFADYMSTNYGMTQGGLAGYFLDPTNAVSDQTMQQNLNQGITAGEANATGFGTLNQSQATALSSFLAQSNQSGLGGIGSVSGAAANNAFTSNLGGGVNGSASQLAALENAGPGQNAGGTVTQNELLSAIGVPGQGTTQAQALIGVSNAQQTRTANSRGGGGAATTSNGAAGLGFAES